MADFVYTNAEFCDMLLLYGECLQNAKEAAAEYRRRFPNRQNAPNPRTFVSVLQRLRDTGTVAHTHAHSRSKWSVGRLRLAQSSNWGTTKNSFTSHNVQQALEPENFPARLTFCSWFVNQLAADHDFTRKVLWTDECCFTCSGIFNMHNSDIWSVENPDAALRFNAQHRFMVNVWAGLYGDQLIGPYLLPEHLTGPLYLEFLQDDVFDDLPLEVRRVMWYMNGGASAHFNRPVRTFLDQECPHRWIGRKGPVTWPARSPDLNPLDFCIWKYMKSIVYKTEVANKHELRVRIEQAALLIRNDPGLFGRIHQSLLNRVSLCIEVNGGVFEHLKENSVVFVE